MEYDSLAKQKTENRWKFQGFCPVCQSHTSFEALHPWFRDHLLCRNCPGGSIPRERALALILRELRPNWTRLHIHESSPSPSGISAVLARDGRHYTASQYFPGEIFGSIVKGVRNENLEEQTFNDELFDIVISLDVMEHVYYPDRVFAEVHRTLKPGGVYICTFPIRNYQVTGWERRFIKKDDGTVEHLKEPEIHGNPVSSEGSIVTVDYGYDLHKTIATWAPFDIRVSRFNDEFHGIIGEYTEVIVCQKRGPRTLAAKVAPVRMGFSRLRRAVFGSR